MGGGGYVTLAPGRFEHRRCHVDGGSEAWAALTYIAMSLACRRLLLLETCRGVEPSRVDSRGLWSTLVLLVYAGAPGQWEVGNVEEPVPGGAGDRLGQACITVCN